MSRQLRVRAGALPEVAPEMLGALDGDRPALAGRHGQRRLMADRRRQGIRVRPVGFEWPKADPTFGRLDLHYQKDPGARDLPAAPRTDVGVAFSVGALVLASLVAAIAPVVRVLGAETRPTLTFLLGVGRGVLPDGPTLDRADGVGVGRPPRPAPFGVVDLPGRASLSLTFSVPSSVLRILHALSGPLTVVGPTPLSALFVRGHSSILSDRAEVAA